MNSFIYNPTLENTVIVALNIFLTSFRPLTVDELAAKRQVILERIAEKKAAALLGQTTDKDCSENGNFMLFVKC